MPKMTPRRNGVKRVAVFFAQGIAANAPQESKFSMMEIEKGLSNNCCLEAHALRRKGDLLSIEILHKRIIP